MAKTKRGFMAKTKTGLVKKKASNTKSKWKREKNVKKQEKKREKEEKQSVQMFKIAKENGSRLVSEGKNDNNKVSPNIICISIILMPACQPLKYSILF